MARQSVSTHTRRTASGKTVTVQQHNRKGRRGRGRQRKKRNGARRGWDNLVKAYKYGRRKKRGTAVFFGALGTVQIGSFVALRGLSLAMVSVAVIATAVAAIAYAASGGSMPRGSDR